ncbi:hypothetical protein AB0D99_33130 [Streptomyces sp. NPDC047971]|uniref:hypothetical protein n=1 Tax=Streptomyces sp. NPDC047971 TaxID=3154499 RepID=UPI003402E459
MSEEQGSGDRGRIRRHVGWWIGLIAGLAGIAGLVFTIVTRDQFTVDEWNQQANAACDTLYGDLLDKYATASTSLYLLDQRGYQSTDYQAAARSWADLGSNNRKLTGEIGKIETPTSHQEDISRLLEELNATSDAEAALAVKLGTEVFTVEDMVDQDKRNKLAEKAQQTFRTIGSSHCFALPPRS